jgi:hypothetical protein
MLVLRTRYVILTFVHVTRRIKSNLVCIQVLYLLDACLVQWVVFRDYFSAILKGCLYLHLQVWIGWPIIYVIVSAFLVLMPFYSSPIETGLTLICFIDSCIVLNIRQC